MPSHVEERKSEERAGNEMNGKILAFEKLAYTE